MPAIKIQLSEAFKLFQAGDYPFSSIKIITRDGKQIERSLLFPKGHPKNRFKLEEYIVSFQQAAQFTLKQVQIEQIVEKILKLEDVDDITEVTSFLHN